MKTAEYTEVLTPTFAEVTYWTCRLVYSSGTSIKATGRGFTPEEAKAEAYRKSAELDAEEVTLTF